VLDVSTTQKYTVFAAPTNTFDLVVSTDNSNAGFLSVHTFELTFVDETSEEFMVHLDNVGYNAEAGITFEFSDLPGLTFYMLLMLKDPLCHA